MTRINDEALSGRDRIATVTEFTRRVKGLLESQIPPGWVRGEVSNLRQQSSGHTYFSLKDAGAQLSAVLFRGDAQHQTVSLRDGQQVIVFGEISVYEARGNYQLIARAIVDDGVGRLQREFEALKQRLQAEGLFATERKRALPKMPRTIGFITSPTGAAVRDFIQILRRRKWRGRVVVLPAKVQGEGAAAELAAMLAQAEQMKLFDVLVIGRGGGSLEDLWAFNEEVLVRAVAASTIPVISAVGHEIDVTLCDFAADVRAETPSAAAELISSHFVACNERLGQAAGSLLRCVQNQFAALQRRVEHQRARLRLLSPTAQVEQGYLRIDDLSNRLFSAAHRQIQEMRRGLVDAAHGLARHSPELRVQQESHRLLALWKRLQAASPKSVLNRGFVILRDTGGVPLQRCAELKPGAAVVAEFADGTASLTAGRKRID